MLLQASRSFSGAFCLLSLCLRDCPTRRIVVVHEKPMLMFIVVFECHLHASLLLIRSVKASLFCRLAHVFSPFAALN